MMKDGVGSLKNNRGSALIIALIIMSFISVLAASLVGVTQSEELMSRSFDGSTSAYYVAEAGMERALSVIRNELNIEYINNAIKAGKQIQDGLDADDVKTVVDGAVRNYFSKSFKNSMKKFEDSPGWDGQVFSDRSNTSCYYEVSQTDMEYMELKDGNKYEIEISLVSAGHYGNYMRTINAKYILSGKINTNEEGYGELESYSKNAITVIGNGFNSFDGLDTSGSVLLYGSSINSNGDVHVEDGNLGVKADNVNFKRSISIDWNLLLDSKHVEIGGPLNLYSGNVYSSYDVDVLSAKELNEYNGMWQTLLTQDRGHFRDDLELKAIDKDNFERKFPGIEIIFLDGPDATIDDGHFNKSYYVIISNGNLNVEVTSFHKPTFIYCTGELNIKGDLNMSGLIIAGNIRSNGRLNVNYKTVGGNGEGHGYGNDKFEDIIEALKDSADDINFTDYEITCSYWNG